MTGFSTGLSLIEMNTKRLPLDEEKIERRLSQISTSLAEINRMLNNLVAIIPGLSTTIRERILKDDGQLLPFSKELLIKIAWPLGWRFQPEEKRFSLISENDPRNTDLLSTVRDMKNLLRDLTLLEVPDDAIQTRLSAMAETSQKLLPLLDKLAA